MEQFLEHFAAVESDTTESSESRDMSGTEMLAYFRTWRSSSGYLHDDNMSTGKLIKRLKTELKLPVGAIVTLPRTREGVKQRYDLVLLRAHFGIEHDDDEPAAKKARVDAGL
jgi:hypothetical protein